MIERLLQLVKLETAGDPMGGLLWTRRSLAKLAEALQKEGIEVCPTTVGKWLRAAKYSPRVNVKCISRISPPGRDAQFKKIFALIEFCKKHDLPIISVDTKKKELIGNFANPGALWCQLPIKVRDHDFRSEAKGRAVPYGVYDLKDNCGAIYLGDSHDTPEFAVDCITNWFNAEARRRYPNAKRMVILADCGGSNSNRAKAWKYFLQKTLCEPHQVQVTVAHYPSGCSKWNPIEHRLFGPISRNWAGRPLDSWETMINYIQTTTSRSGLHVDAIRVTKQYQTGVKISKSQMEKLNFIPNNVLPKWNYDIYPLNFPIPAYDQQGPEQPNGMNP